MKGLSCVDGGSLLPCSLLLAGLLLPCASRAQCTLSWLPGMGTPGVQGSIEAMCAWDPDGPGPQPPHVVVGGPVWAAGQVGVQGVCAFEPASATWISLGSDLVGAVQAVTATSNGVLYAAGAITAAGGQPCNRIARWQGSGWASVGTGTSGTVSAMVTLPNDDLVAGGAFTTAGGIGAQFVARWDGQSWSPLGNGLPNSVTALATTPAGDVVAATSNQAWLWQSGTWTQLGGSAAGSIHCIAVGPNGDVYIGGQFAVVSGVPAAGMARWDGVSWQPVGVGFGYGTTPGAQARVEALLFQPNGNLLAAGEFTTAGGNPAVAVASWDGANWGPLGSGLFKVSNGNARGNAMLALPNGGTLVAGEFQMAGGVPVANIAAWNGSTWSATGSGINGDTVTAAELPNGDLVVAGSFLSIGPGVACDRVARRSGGVWSAFGPLPLVGSVTAMTTTDDGAVLVAGLVPTGSTSTSAVLRWNGSTWSPLGSPPAGTISLLRSAPNGDVWCGGSLQSPTPLAIMPLARWDGTSWQAVPMPAAWGPLGPLGRATALEWMPNGDAVLGLSLGWPTNRGLIARWTGGTWTQLGGDLTGSFGGASAAAFATDDAGQLFAGGSFTAIGGVPMAHVARWDGTSWQPLGTGLDPAGGFFVGAGGMTTLPGGDLVVGGLFAAAGGVPVKSLARWNGQAWSAVTDYTATGSGIFLEPTWLRSGSLVVTGYFRGVPANPSPFFGELTTSCLADAQAYGAACAPWPLTSTKPWSGGRWTLRCDGMPNGTLVARLLGHVPQQQPLLQLFADAPAGCELLLHPDAVDALVVSGPLQSTIQVPPMPALAGLQYRAQLVLAGPGLIGPGPATVSTNGVQVTVGHF